MGRLSGLLMLFLYLIHTNGSDLCSPSSRNFVNHNLEAAMVGYDPVMANPYGSPDPGFRFKIFEAYQKDRDELNAFIGKSQMNIHCDTEVNTAVLTNYNQYKIRKFSSVQLQSDSYLVSHVVGCGAV